MKGNHGRKQRRKGRTESVRQGEQEKKRKDKGMEEKRRDRGGEMNGERNVKKREVRAGMGTYAGATRRRVHLATVLLRPPSGHRPG